MVVPDTVLDARRRCLAGDLQPDTVVLSFWPDSDDALAIVNLRGEPGDALGRWRRRGFVSWEQDELIIPRVHTAAVVLLATTANIRIAGEVPLSRAGTDAANWPGTGVDHCLLAVTAGATVARPALLADALERGDAVIGEVAVQRLDGPL